MLELAELGELRVLPCGLERGLGLRELLAQREHGGDDAAAGRDLGAHRARLRVELGELLLQARAREDALPVVVVGERRDLRSERVDAAREAVDLGGNAVDLDALPGGRLVEEIDRGVGERAVGQVALGERDGGDDGALADAHVVVLLVLRRDAAEDLGGLIDGGRLEGDRREAAQDRGVALVDLAHAFGRRGREQADLAAREERLEQVADAGARHALAEEGVDLLDDEDALAVLLLRELVDDGLQALLDLAAELRASDERARVELVDVRRREVRGDVAVRDAIGERVHEGRLADAGLADDERVVLEAALEDLQQAPDLDVAADDGVEAAGASVGDEVAREAVLALVGAGGRGRGLARGGLGERADVRAEGAGADPEGGEDLARGAADLLCEGVQEVLDADRGRLVARRLALRATEQVEQARAHVGDAAGALRRALQGLLGELPRLVRVGAGAAAVFDDEAGDGGPLGKADALVDLGVGGEGAGDFGSGGVAVGVEDAGEGVGSFAGAGEFSVFCVKGGAPLDELGDADGALGDESLCGRAVDEAVASVDGVFQVEADVLVALHGDGDTSLGVVGVGLGDGFLGGDEDVAMACELDGGAEAGDARADDEIVRLGD